MDRAFLSILLHAHLPFVRHPEQRRPLEENWFFESCTECYIPLLASFEKMAGEGVDFRLTVSLSPTLMSMMTDDLLKERYLEYLDRAVRLGTAECERTARDEKFNRLSLMYLRHLEFVRRYFTGCGGDLPSRFGDLRSKGRLDLITTSATHAFLPLVHTEEARRAQIEVGLNLFGRLFGGVPSGFWLPECGYDRGLDLLLQEFGIKYFVVDTHGLLSASPEPACGVYAPVQCRSGVAVFGRDPESSRQVWERRMGYPGHPDYREFYRDIAYDLDAGYLEPYLPEGPVRVDTGFKYYRITGRGDNKEVYDPDAARKTAEVHARHFLWARARQADRAFSRMDRPPLMLAPYDAELFGHWWYEGPVWLEHVLRQAAAEKIKTVTPGDYLALYSDNQVVDLFMSSWGEGGYSYVWLNPKNDWIYRHQHAAEVKMTELADLNRRARGTVRRALNQAGRELLLAQSSDWAFILKEGTTVGYASGRVADHLNNFLALAGQIESGAVDEALLGDLESRNNIFPDLDFTVFGTRKVYPGLFKSSAMRIIMLSWEYPPRTVGGLGRHVHDLSRALSGLGLEVHVFTCPAHGRPPYEVDETGVHVHRLSPEELDTGDFLEWLVRLNAGMVRRAEERGLSRGFFDLVHAHDWLVRDAAGSICEKYRLPLVVTIHATEYGRNRGIFTDLQRQIHGIEADLVARANRVICCSSYMAREVRMLFGEGQGGIKVIPNGVDPGSLADGTGAQAEKQGFFSGGPVMAFLGRLVPEKGVQVIIEALPLIMERHPGVLLVVAGRGPYEEELRRLAERRGVAGHVKFIGFVDDLGRNRLLAEASVAVFPSIYEPFGIVALEAMAAGTPVLVSDTGGLSEIVSHGIDGLKVPPGRADLLARYVLELLDRPDLARKLGRKAYRKVVSRYDWNRIALETAGVYLGVLRRGAGGKPSGDGPAAAGPSAAAGINSIYI